MSAANITMMSRQQLYECVWSTPAQKLAVEFGLSDVGLAKICKRHNIPRPPRGYWAKRAARKKVRRPPLPRIFDRGLEYVHIPRRRTADDLRIGVAVMRAPAMIQVADRLARPHPLIVHSRQILRAAKAGDDQLVSPNLQAGLAIRVSRTLLDRALRIFDALVKHWESMGGTVVVGQVNVFRQPFTELRLYEESIRIDLHEVIERIPTRPGVRIHWRSRNFKCRPTGRLVFRIHACCCRATRKSWADGIRQRLESMLGPIADTLTDILVKKKHDRLDEECEARQWSSLKRSREAAAKREEELEQRRAKLLEDVQAWKTAGEIRAYLCAMRRRLESSELAITDEAAFIMWMKWATWYSDYLDPLISTPPSPEVVRGPTNMSVRELDLTNKTRRLVERLQVADTDELHAISRAMVERIGGNDCAKQWNEICRVLERFGYDVHDRYEN